MAKAYWIKKRQIDIDQYFLGLGIFGPEEYEWECSGCGEITRGGSSPPASCDSCGNEEFGDDVEEED